MIFTFVNGRAVRDKLLARAVTQAYQTLMPRGRHPAVVLFLELKHDEVDVNVHPMKTEVRFKNSGAVFEIVYHALRDRLANQTDPRRSRMRRPTAIDAVASRDPRVGRADDSAGAGASDRATRIGRCGWWRIIHRR